MKIGITRVRNEEVIIGSTLNLLKNHLDGVIVYDDYSTDSTYEICKSDPFVLDIISSDRWESDPQKRMKLESIHRNIIYNTAVNNYNPDWVLYFDGDEHIYFDDIDWASNHSYFFRLFDVYITPEDVNKHFLDREYIGCEYRDIPMLFRPNKNVYFYNRLPYQINTPRMGGTVKHFGKGISVEHWEETCDYYINHLHEVGKTGETISSKWSKRKGKAIHDGVGDFGKQLIRWHERYQADKIQKLTV
jgi:glycosyltransferase involved in cell wall biosynthesis